MSAILKNIFNNIIDLLPDIPIGSKGENNNSQFQVEIGRYCYQNFYFVKPSLMVQPLKHSVFFLMLKLFRIIDCFIIFNIVEFYVHFLRLYVISNRA